MLLWKWNLSIKSKLLIVDSRSIAAVPKDKSDQKYSCSFEIDSAILK